MLPKFNGHLAAAWIAVVCVRRLLEAVGNLQQLRHSLYQQGRRNGRSKQISAPIETGEGQIPEKRGRIVQFWALGFSRDRRKGHAVENLAGGLKTETVRCKLPVVQDVKMEIPGEDLSTQFNQGVRNE